MTMVIYRQPLMVAPPKTGGERMIEFMQGVNEERMRLRFLRIKKGFGTSQTLFLVVLT